MAIAIIFLASIPAYIAGSIAMVMGAGWLMALVVLTTTGCVLSCLLMLLVVLRDRIAASAKRDLPFSIR